MTTLFILPGPLQAQDRIAELCQAYITILNSFLPNMTSDRRTLAESATLPVAEIIVQTTLSLDLASIRRNSKIIAFAKQHNVQLAFQKNHIYRRYKRLAVFDMDSTLIQQEVIDEIARKLGVEDQVAAITTRAMNGELDFTASLRERVALLRGTPTSIFEALDQIAKGIVKVIHRVALMEARVRELQDINAALSKRRRAKRSRI